MNLRTLVQNLLAAAVIFVSTLSAQSLDQFKALYSTEGVFQIRPTILMTPYYGSKGNLCGVFLQANRFPSVPQGISVGTIDPDNLAAVVQELAPKETQNKLGMSFYFKRGENVSIAKFWFNDLYVYVTGASRSRLSGQLPATDEIGSVKKEVVESTLLDFLRSFGDVDVARVWWNRRDGCHDR
jgi:hypothetical protein